MLPELHVFKVLFYAESVSVVTFGHVTKMAVTPFDPQLPKTPAIRKLHGSFIEPEVLPIEVLHSGKYYFLFASQKGRSCRGNTSFEL